MDKGISLNLDLMVSGNYVVIMIMLMFIYVYMYVLEIFEHYLGGGNEFVMRLVYSFYQFKLQLLNHTYVSSNSLNMCIIQA